MEHAEAFSQGAGQLTRRMRKALPAVRPLQLRILFVDAEGLHVGSHVQHFAFGQAVGALDFPNVASLEHLGCHPFSLMTEPENVA